MLINILIPIFSLATTMTMTGLKGSDLPPILASAPCTNHCTECTMLNSYLKIIPFYFQGCGPAPLEIGLAHLVDPVYGPGMPIMKGGGAYIGEERYYKCKQGYVETGPIQVVCLADKWATRWTIPEHSCTGKL